MSVAFRRTGASESRPASSIAFLNIAMHGHVNPTLPVVAELVRRGHSVDYHTSPTFAEEIEATGATVHLYPGGDRTLPEPLMPVTLLDGLARTSLDVLPTVLADLRLAQPDLIVHDSTCPWGAVAARELGVPAVSSYTMFAFNEQAPSPGGPSWEMLAAAASRPGNVQSYVRARWTLSRRYDTRGLPLIDLLNVRQPLNIVYTSREFQPGGDALGPSYRFVGPSIGARLPDPSFPAGRLRDPVLYASLGTLLAGRPLLRTFATALAPLAGTLVLSTGLTDPAALGELPPNVIARRHVPQLDVLARSALFITHGGMNSVNEALYAGVPMLVIPHGADQPLVARRVTGLGAGLWVRPEDAAAGTLRTLARRLLDEPRFRTAAVTLQSAQRDAGGYHRAADELEQHLQRVGRVTRLSHPDDLPEPAAAPRDR